MKKTAVLLAGAVLCACLAGCSQLPPPEKAADGAAWSADWVTVGNVVGVDAPEGVDARENSDSLADKGMYYATWSIGGEEPYVNADGEDAKVYGAQIYLLLAGHSSVEKAEEALAEWTSMAASRYQVEASGEAVHNGQPFTVITCAYPSETNPYQRGAAAFGIYRNYALSVELSCREGFDGDAAALLADFLERCHYAA